MKYIGPGLLVTIGFIDPGNWATNLAAGTEYGYALLWIVTLSSIMPQFPRNSMLIIMGVLGAVVMTHNLFLHSEIIQSRE